MEKDPSLCGKTVDMEMFGLDDGQSWVVIGKASRWKQHRVDAQSGKLYCVDEETENMRRQTVEEVKNSRWRLAMTKAKFMEDDNDSTYMPIVRYLEVSGKKR